jgi:hypothetical protein
MNEKISLVALLLQSKSFVTGGLFGLNADGRLAIEETVGAVRFGH